MIGLVSSCHVDSVLMWQQNTIWPAQLPWFPWQNAVINALNVFLIWWHGVPIGQIHIQNKHITYELYNIIYIINSFQQHQVCKTNNIILFCNLISHILDTLLIEFLLSLLFSHIFSNSSGFNKWNLSIELSALTTDRETNSTEWCLCIWSGSSWAFDRTPSSGLKPGTKRSKPCTTGKKMSSKNLWD